MYNAIIDKRSSDRGLTTALWRDIEAMGNVDPRYGNFWMDDFKAGRIVDDSSGTGTFVTSEGVYVHTVATANDGLASIYTAGGTDGIVTLDAETNVAGEGLTLTGTGPCVTPAAGRIIVFESRQALVTAGTVTQFIVGLVQAGCTAPLTGGATLVVNTTNVTDFVGYNNISGTNPSASLFTYKDEAGETAVQGTTAIHTIEAGSYFKSGFKIVGLDYIEYWVQGYKNGNLSTDFTFHADSTSIPSVALVPIVAVQSDDGSTTASARMDWWAVGTNARASA